MVIPLGDHNPTRHRGWVTWLLVAVNVAVFVAFTPWWGDACNQQEFYLRYAAVPAELSQGEPLDARELALTTPRACDIRPVADKDVYVSILTAMFLHGGWSHLLFNMLYLLIFGNNVEDRFGHLKFLAFYLLSGLVATVVFALPNANSPATLVGASGAIAGVLGAYLVLFPRARVTVAVPVFLFLVVQLPAVVVLGLWFLLQLPALRLGETSGSDVAYLAHVAGFIAGVVLTLLPVFRPRRPPPRPRTVPPGWAPPTWRS